MGCQGSK
jgi:thiosulfate/3-mercaptopyruvate sulfurtransferase